jgi:hypothetical protein
VIEREVVYIERMIEPSNGQFGADILLFIFESYNAGFSSLPERKLLS